MKIAQPLTYLQVIGVPYRNADYTEPIVSGIEVLERRLKSWAERGMGLG